MIVRATRKVDWLRPTTNELSLSVITDPLPIGISRWIERGKSGLRGVRAGYRRLFRPLPEHLISDYRGHPAVTGSLLRGLTELGVPFSYNPKSLEQLADAVIVLSGIAAVRQMIQLKQQGYIRCLLVGPNVMNEPTEHDGILGASEIDACITPGEAVCRLYECFLPPLRGRCIAWLVGVDAAYWAPDLEIVCDWALIYYKPTKGPVDSIGPYMEMFRHHGFDVLVVFYGSYSAAEYLDLLRRAFFMIGFTCDES